MRRLVRTQFEPLLPDAAREAIQSIDADDGVSQTLKKSARRLLVDQREFVQCVFRRG